MLNLNSCQRRRCVIEALYNIETLEEICEDQGLKFNGSADKGAQASSLHFQHGDLVWAKMKGYPSWPAQIIRKKAPSNKKSHKYVFFFGSRNYGWIHTKNIVPHNESTLNTLGTKKTKALQKAISELKLCETQRHVNKNNRSNASSLSSPHIFSAQNTLQSVVRNVPDNSSLAVRDLSENSESVRSADEDPQSSEYLEVDSNETGQSSEELPAQSASGIQSSQDFPIGDLVWAKLKGHPHWPARIVSEKPGNLKLVYLFGLKAYSWVECQDMIPHSEAILDKFRKNRTKTLRRAIEELFKASKKMVDGESSAGSSSESSRHEILNSSSGRSKQSVERHYSSEELPDTGSSSSDQEGRQNDHSYCTSTTFSAKESLRIQRNAKKHSLPVNTKLLPFSFHTVHGSMAKLNINRTDVTKKMGVFSLAYVFTERPIEFGETVTMSVSRTFHCPHKFFEYGVTSCDPKNIHPRELPECSDELLDRSEYWVVKEKRYEFEAGDTITFKFIELGEVEFSINGTQIDVLNVDNSERLWLFINLTSGILQLHMDGIINENPKTTSIADNTEIGVPGPSGLQSPNECVICYENQVNCVIYRCGHMCMCYKCALKLWMSGSRAHCPICRNSIKDVIKIYK